MHGINVISGVWQHGGVWHRSNARENASCFSMASPSAWHGGKRNVAAAYQAAIAKISMAYRRRNSMAVAAWRKWRNNRNEMSAISVMASASDGAGGVMASAKMALMAWRWRGVSQRKPLWQGERQRKPKRLAKAGSVASAAQRLALSV
jgi:hypothetical protein